ncbi:ATP-binding protein [Lentzea guizhouensis]|uniref:ATP-binding protein n=1 Tax=Lentzea guizhouensis TaxID=1586287 RepID=UPI000A9A6E3B|nr:tetratricopeptide repeat protein [Lentzea guizhouensis]
MGDGTRNNFRGDAKIVVQAEAIYSGAILDLPRSNPSAVLSLPRATAAFTGRSEELAVLLATAGELYERCVVAVHAIDGMAGIGKTAFAIHAAHRLADQFPDAQLFLRLHAHTPGRRAVEPVDALGSLLTAIGVAAQNVPAGVDARAAMWRSQMAGKRALIVLDDASGHQQVEPLLPSTSGCLVLVTSRRRLAALETSLSMALDTLPVDEATRLFFRLSGCAVDDVSVEAVARIVGMCGYLPLAIALLAGRLRHRPSWSVGDLADSLSATRNRLSELRAEDLAVASAFELSYRDLSPARQRFFISLGLHPGSEMDAWTAAALAGISAVDAREHLEGLYDDHLLDEPSRGRYRMHDLVREYSRSLEESDGSVDRDAALGRLVDYYDVAAAKADGFITAEITREAPKAAADALDPQVEFAHLTTRVEAWDWMRNEYANILACVERIAVSPSSELGVVMRLAASLATFFVAVGPWDRAIELHESAALVAEKCGDRLAVAQALHRIGRLQWLTGHYPESISNLKTAAAIYGELHHRLGQVRALVQLGGALRQADEYAKAANSYLDALKICRSAGNRLDEAAALNGLGIIRFVQGRLVLAVESHQQALEIFRSLGDRLGQADARNELGVVKRVMGENVESIEHHEMALAVYRDLNDGYHDAFTLNNLGTAWRMAGLYEKSMRLHNEAIGVSRRLGDRVGLAVGFGELAASLRMTGHLETAVDMNARALELFRSIGHRLGVAQTLNEKGSILLALDQAGEAVQLHEQALEISRTVGAPLEEARALEGAGRCAASLGQVDLASVQLRRAMDLYERIGAAETATLAYESLGPGDLA